MEDNRISIKVVPGYHGPLNTNGMGANYWYASVDIDGSPAYDGSGVTVELALSDLVSSMANALLDDS